METLHISFKVTVSKNRYSSYKDDGDADLEFDIAEDMFKQETDYSALLLSLVKVAYNNYLNKQTEEEKE